MARIALLALAAIGAASATELNRENWDAITDGKTVFVQFCAPWDRDCMSMKPTWDKVMENNADDATTVVAEVDCTAGKHGDPFGGRALCDEIGVRENQYPSIQYGDPRALEALRNYTGGRDLESLMKFARNLGPMCSPWNIDLCGARRKARINKLMDMSQANRDALLQDATPGKRGLLKAVNKFMQNKEANAGWLV